MNRTTVILLGGFLGAGKTSLMARAAEHLARQGKKTGLVTNDQAADMVDTRFLEQRGHAVREVSGSCFCCDFDGLIAALDSLRDQAGADIILAEAVGSCTDLSATILQPLKDKLRDRFDARPASVLVDPARLAEVEPELAAPAGAALKSADLHPSAAYIIEKQMEEADILVLNKTDLRAEAEKTAALSLLERKHPRARVVAMSVAEDRGVAEWLDAVLADGAVRTGDHIVSVDYDTYAEGEAVLGWLNASVRLRAEKTPAPWRELCADLVAALGADLAGQRLYSGHVKAVISDPAGRGAVLCDLTRTGGTPRVQGGLSPDCAEAELIVNARVAMPPEDLEALVRARVEALSSRPGLRAEVERLKSLRPGRPNPTWRYDRVI